MPVPVTWAQGTGGSRTSGRWGASCRSGWISAWRRRASWWTEIVVYMCHSLSSYHPIQSINQSINEPSISVLVTFQCRGFLKEGRKDVDFHQKLVQNRKIVCSHQVNSYNIVQQTCVLCRPLFRGRLQRRRSRVASSGYRANDVIFTCIGFSRH